MTALLAFLTSIPKLIISLDNLVLQVEKLATNVQEAQKNKWLNENSADLFKLMGAKNNEEIAKSMLILAKLRQSYPG